MSEPAKVRASLSYATVAGHGGIPLAVTQSGNREGPSILFVHGWSQCALSWDRQLHDARLAARFNMVAFDLRGHGASAKPHDAAAYNDSRIWAGDVAAVIAAMGMVRPVLVAWSYGGMVAMAYLRHYGSPSLSGLSLVAAATTLDGPYPPLDLSDPRVQRQMQGLARMTSDDLRANLHGTQEFVSALTARPLRSAQSRDLLLQNMLTPAYVRRATHAFMPDNSDLRKRIQSRVLVTHGDCDALFPLRASQDNAAALQGAQLSIYPGVGHAPFLEQAGRFNRELAGFVTDPAPRVVRR